MSLQECMEVAGKLRALAVKDIGMGVAETQAVLHRAADLLLVHAGLDGNAAEALPETTKPVEIPPQPESQIMGVPPMAPLSPVEPTHVVVDEPPPVYSTDVLVNPAPGNGGAPADHPNG